MGTKWVYTCLWWVAVSTGWSVYVATRFAVMGLSEVAAEDVKEFGIHVTAIAPGVSRTSF
nr:SDR family NAD(P)-dependent oxidoreductase [uncultured Flavobacterium sp.]